MTKLVESVQVCSVADLYFQYARYGAHYEQKDNPLWGMTRFVPAKAQYYAVAPVSDIELTYTVMKGLARRRKLRQVQVSKAEINWPIFAPTDQLMIFYV